MANPIENVSVFSTSKDRHHRVMVSIHCSGCGNTDTRVLSRPDMPPNVVAKWFKSRGWETNRRLTSATCQDCRTIKRTDKAMQQPLAMPMVVPAKKAGPALDAMLGALEHDVHAKVEFITPTMALELLEANTRNRPLRWNWIRELTDTITEGRWRLNGETIKIARDGQIIDGQHRLHAIVEAGQGVRNLVARGMDPDVFDTIDIGRKRSPGDILAVDGETNASTLAAGVGVLHAILTGQDVARRQGRTPLRDVLAAHPHIRESVAPAMRCRTFRARGPAIALHYLLGQVDPAGRDALFEKLTTGLGLTADDPAYYLRERLLAGGTTHGGKDTPTQVVANTLHTWELIANGRTIRKFQSPKRKPLEVIADFLEAHGLG